MSAIKYLGMLETNLGRDKPTFLVKMIINTSILKCTFEIVMDVLMHHSTFSYFERLNLWLFCFINAS
jgi:hypothetical protein